MRSVSVVVCTRDRPAALAACLRSLADEPAAEILVIDNGSTPPIGALDGARVVLEPEVGLALARNTGLAQATGEVVLFLDDDVTSTPGLVAAHAAAYEAGVVAVGGPIRFAPAHPRPIWLDPSLDEYLSVLDRGPVATDLGGDDPPYGANLSVDRQIALDAGGFDIRRGRRGNDLSIGEERELLERLMREGGRIRWTPDGAVDHHIPSERLRLRWFARRAWAQGTSDFRDEPRDWVLAARLAWSAVRPGGTPWPEAGPPALPARFAVEMVRRVRLLGAGVALVRR